MWRAFIMDDVELELSVLSAQQGSHPEMSPEVAPGKRYAA